jgi:cysteine desulfurase/selenocysteine lyase
MPAPYDVALVRNDFPALEREVNGRPLVYLDNAATAHKPTVVLDALADFYEHYNANVHRGVHTLAAEATAAYEDARAAVARYIGAPAPSEIVFTKNATEAINVVAYALGTPAGGPAWRRLGPGDEICVTEMEHHSNLVPWQLLCERTGATLRWIGLTDEGRLDLAHLDTAITERTKLVAFVHQSNLLGTINPTAPIIERARAVGALTLVDASQSAAHGQLDVAALGADFVVFTGHKVCAPTGIGVLWGRAELLADMPPFLAGGEMVGVVEMTGSTYAPPPQRFEAGTPPIAQAIGLGAAVGYLSELGLDLIAAHERALTAYALEGLRTVPGLRIIGPDTTEARGGAISFVIDGVHAHDVGQVLDADGIAVRVGHHCARPACVRLGVEATARASFHVYTTMAEVEALVDAVAGVRGFFA